jgi:hypothetical protein
MNFPSEIYFDGCNDGIGNRLFQIVNLIAIKNKYNINSIKFLWNNPIDNSDRVYPIRFRSSDIEIVKFIPHELINMDKIWNWEHILSNNDIQLYAKRVYPTFNIQFPNNIKPFGIHIRRGDKINNEPITDKNSRSILGENKMSHDESIECIDKTLEYINNIKPKYIYVCSDDITIKEYFIGQLHNSIQFIEPIIENNIEKDYSDFFALSLCSEIFMCSRHSTYAMLASLIGGIKLHMYYDFAKNHNLYDLLRYKPDYICHYLYT